MLAEDHLFLQGVRVPICSPLVGPKPREPITGPLPPVLRALLPLLEQAYLVPAIERPLRSPEGAEAMWDAFAAHTQRLREEGKTAHDTDTMESDQDLRLAILDILEHGLAPVDGSRTLAGALLSDVRARNLLRRVLAGERVRGNCRHYAFLFQALFRLGKQFLGLDKVWCVVVTGKPTMQKEGHAWNWLLHADANAITAVDAHTAAWGVGNGARTIINTGLDASDGWNVSAFASHLMCGYQLWEAMQGHGDIESFFAALFVGADDPAVIGCQIGQHGLLHTRVEARLLERLGSEEERRRWRERLDAGHIPLRRLMSAELQSRLLVPALGSG